MKKFNEYRELTEASRGERMETSIVTAWNGNEKKMKGVDLGAGAEVVKYLKSQGVNGTGEEFGSGTVDVSKFWEKFWEGGKVPTGTKTPKTDFIIGKHKISLKTGTAAQLMSGARQESTATFHAALKNIKKVPVDIIDQIHASLEEFAPSSVTLAGNVKDSIKLGKDKKLLKANKAHKKFTSLLQNTFTNFPEFEHNFVSEAMSGDVKFNKNKGAATHFLTVSWDGKKASLVNVKKKSYINKILKQTKISVRFKTGSVKKIDKLTKEKVKTGQYRYWSVVGLITNKLQQTAEELEQLDGDMLTEGIINRILDKAKEFILKLIRAVMRWVSKNYNNLISFLSIEPDISVNTTVNTWP